MSQAVERPNRPEIIKLNPKADRPVEPASPQAKAARPIQPHQRHRPKPSPHSKQHGKRQPPKPLSAPDGSPTYQAIGCLYGQLQLQHRQAAIVTPEGQTHPIATIRDQRLLFWLLTHPDRWSEQAIDWHVYPSPPYGYTLMGAGTTGDRQREPGAFTIQGAYRPGRAEGEFVLFVGRNNPKDKGNFAFVTIQGELPDAVERQLWRCQCKLEGERLVLVETLKLEGQPIREELSTEERSPQRATNEHQRATNEREGSQNLCSQTILIILHDRQNRLFEEKLFKE